MLLIQSVTMSRSYPAGYASYGYDYSGAYPPPPPPPPVPVLTQPRIYAASLPAPQQQPSANVRYVVYDQGTNSGSSCGCGGSGASGAYYPPAVQTVVQPAPPAQIVQTGNLGGLVPGQLYRVVGIETGPSRAPAATLAQAPVSFATSPPVPTPTRVTYDSYGYY